jgi:hypothetical protein
MLLVVLVFALSLGNSAAGECDTCGDAFSADWCADNHPDPPCPHAGCGGTVDTGACVFMQYCQPISPDPPHCSASERGCCQKWTGGYAPPWRSVANAFKDATARLFLDEPVKAATEAMLADVPLRLLARREHGDYLACVNAAIFQVAYDAVAAFAGEMAGAIREHPRAQCSLTAHTEHALPLHSCTLTLHDSHRAHARLAQHPCTLLTPTRLTQCTPSPTLLTDAHVVATSAVLAAGAVRTCTRLSCPPRRQAWSTCS